MKKVGPKDEKNNFHDLEKGNWKEERKGKRVFCFENCSDLLWEQIVLVIENKFCTFEAEGQEFEKKFDSTRTIYSNSERSVQFLKQNTCYWWFLRSDTLEEIKCQLEHIIGM